jgi:hypothetical protein
MFLPPLVAVVPLGFACANVVIWLITPARRALDKEALPGTGFRESTMLLLRFGFSALAIAVLLGLLGVFVV